MWSPYTDAGIAHANAQPARTRAVALEISKLAEISSDLLVSFYQPNLLDKPSTKQVELKKLTDIHTRLEAWKNDLPQELEAKEGQLPPVLLMHMFFQLLYIHLYRPFLRFTKSTSPLPVHVSPRKYCTQAASAISKLLRLYKRTHGLRQIINKVVYIAHTACTIHLLNLPDKNAKRDIVHGVKQLEEMGDCWTAARRTLRVLNLCAERWKIELPDEAQAAMTRTKARWEWNEPGTGQVSPDTFTTMTQQITMRSVPDMMAQNLQQQQQHIASQQPSLQLMRLHQEQLGLSEPVALSPSETAETRRSSGNFSLPPRSAADLIRNSGRIRPSMSLTKEQQDAWNALQARMEAASAQQAANTVVGANASAQALFGGVESLIGESQDWWYNDQRQLALGFDNWTSSESDWNNVNSAALGLGMGGNNAGRSDVPAVGSDGFFTQNVDAMNMFGRGDPQQPMQRYSNGEEMDPATSAALQRQYEHQQHRIYKQAQLKRQMDWADDDFYS